MKNLYLCLLLMLPAWAFAQISGSVKDTKNVPLGGISINIKGTKISTASNDNGRFFINYREKKVVLRFTGAAFEPLEVEWNGETNIDVILVARVNKLDEVQVIAYGTNTQRLNVGSVTKVSAEDINKQAVNNPLSALEGMVPGLVITPTSGLPGSTISVQVRGQNTINSAQAFNAPQDNPLFVIDGVPFAPQNNNVNQFKSLASPGDSYLTNNSAGGISPFNSINPADIESIEVLRDADATAIYGSRGGNGVILITTKRGKAGKTNFDLNVRNGVSFLGPTMPMMNTQQYHAMREEAFRNDGITPNATLYDPGYAPDLTIFDTTRYTNWKKQFLGNTAKSTNAYASLSGGTNETQFRLGAGFNRDTYILPGDFGDNRATFSSSIHHQSPDKKFTIDFSAGYSYEKNNSSNATNLLSVLTLEPDYPAQVDANGNLIWNYKGVGLDGSAAGSNPYAYLKDLYSVSNTNLNSSLLVAYQLLKGLTFRSSLGYNTFGTSEYSAVPAGAQNPAFSPQAFASFGSRNNATWIIEPQLEYKGVWKKSSISILLGSTFQKQTNASTDIEASGYINDSLIGSISGAPTTQAFDAYSDYKYDAVFGRINYNWDEEFIVDLNGRRDGSSRFGPGREFGNFGSAGAGWLFYKEDFIRDNLGFLSYGKIRGSYGITGSDNVADYAYLARYAPTNYAYQGGLGYLPQNLYNPDLGWATTKKLELGMELGFLQDKLLFTGSWYRNRSGNQITTYLLPGQTGFASVYENFPAVVQNTGVELSLRSTLLKSADFSWMSSFNITVPQNKLIAFPGLASSSYSTTYRIGQPLSVINGFKSAGVDPQTGLFQFFDAAGKITATPNYPGNGQYNDYYNLGNTDPKFYGGFQNSFNYKGLQLDVYIVYKKQMGSNYLRAVYSGQPGLEGNVPAALEGRWQTQGQQTSIQKFSSQYGDAYNAASEFDVSSGVYSDASYIRLKTLSLSYAIPAKFLKGVHIPTLRFYAAGQNLFTITGYKGNDPETQIFYGIPTLKSLTFGLQLNL